MALRDPRGTVTAAYCLPDAVAFQYCYALPPQTQAYTVRNELRQLVEGPKDAIGMSLRFTLRVPGIEAPVKAKFTKPGANKPAFIKVFLSPLRALRVRGLSSERPKDGQENYLSANQITDDNSFVARRVAEDVYRIEARLFDLMSCVAARLSAQGFTSLLEIKVHALEVSADFSAADPGGVITRLSSSVSALCTNVVQSTYRQTASQYAGICCNSLMVWGFASSGLRVKGYEKTTRRIRLEAAFDKHALQQKLGSRAIQDADDFEVFFKRAATYVAPLFTRVLQPLTVASDGHADPIALIAEAFAGMRQPAALEALRTLMRNERIRGGLDREVARAWHGRGLIERTAFGQYSVTPRYRAALRAIQVMVDGRGSFGEGAGR